ncbi:MAG: hypothetical protein GEV12_16345 [Micromonosporaceae bacterium]|nr:hypothetical protein [Micromonosporaceae bacterium]
MREPRSHLPPGDRAAGRAARDRRADRVEERLALPVIIAATVSVPAVFLSVMTEGTAAVVGTALNWASLAVLTVESGLLFLLAGHRIAWLWRHRWTLTILALAIPAVAFVVAPAQSLRLVVQLVRLVGALRVLRAGRILKAGRVLARRIGGDGPKRRLPLLVGSVVAAGFVALVLSDPTSSTRRVLDQLESRSSLGLALAAGAILAGATFVVVRYRRRGSRSDPEPAVNPED